MTAQDHARDCAKRILIYLDLDITDRRLAKIGGLLSEHMEKYAPIKEVIRIVEKKTQVYRYKALVIPSTECNYVPVYQQNKLMVLNHVGKFVCDKHGITLDQLKRNSPAQAYRTDLTGLRRRLYKRCSLFVDARQEFCFLLQEHYQEIPMLAAAVFLGYRDHSTVYHLLHNRNARNWKNIRVSG